MVWVRMRGCSTASGNSMPTVGAVIGREKGAVVYQAYRIARFAATDRSCGGLILKSVAGAAVTKQLRPFQTSSRYLISIKFPVQGTWQLARTLQSPTLSMTSQTSSPESDYTNRSSPYIHWVGATPLKLHAFTPSLNNRRSSCTESTSGLINQAYVDTAALYRWGDFTGVTYNF